MPDAQSSAICNARLVLRLGLGFIWVYEGLVPKLLVPLTGLERDIVAASGLGIESQYDRPPSRNASTFTRSFPAAHSTPISQ